MIPVRKGLDHDKWTNNPRCTVLYLMDQPPDPQYNWLCRTLLADLLQGAFHWSSDSLYVEILHEETSE